MRPRGPTAVFPLNPDSASWCLHGAERTCCLMHFFLSSFLAEVPPGQAWPLYPSQESLPLGREAAISIQDKLESPLLSFITDLLTEPCAWGRGSGGWKSGVIVLRKPILEQNFTQQIHNSICLWWGQRKCDRERQQRRRCLTFSAMFFNT